MISTETLQIRSLAHIGDAVYEVFAREVTVMKTENIKKLHALTVNIVNAKFQADLLTILEPNLTEQELDIIRRARNLAVTTARRTNHTQHRLSTAFEALIGYLHINDKNRLNEIYKIIMPAVEATFE